MIDPLELHAYADGQLEATDRARVSRQLETDPASKAQLDSILSLKQFVSTNCQAVECKDEWKKCLGRLNELDKAKRTESFVGKYAWALCGVFFVAILMGGVMSRNNPNSGRESADLARLAASFSPAGAPVSKEPVAMRRWLDSLVGQAAASVSPERLDIVSASTGELDGSRAAKLVLRDSGGDMALVMVNSNLNLDELPMGGEQPYHVGQLQGSNCIAWHDRENTLVLVGNRPYDELIPVANKLVH